MLEQEYKFSEDYFIFARAKSHFTRAKSFARVTSLRNFAQLCEIARNYEYIFGINFPGISIFVIYQRFRKIRHSLTDWQRVKVRDWYS
jgi:hypothetical protein